MLKKYSKLLHTMWLSRISGPKLLSWCTRSSTAVHRCSLARSFRLPTFQVATDFALPATTASFSLQFTAPLLAAKHFRLLALRYGTGCHRRLRQHRLWQPPQLTRDVPIYWIISWHLADMTFCVYTLSIPSSVLNALATLKIHDWLICFTSQWPRFGLAKKCQRIISQQLVSIMFGGHAIQAVGFWLNSADSRKLSDYSSLCLIYNDILHGW